MAEAVLPVVVVAVAVGGLSAAGPVGGVEVVVEGSRGPVGGGFGEGVGAVGVVVVVGSGAEGVSLAAVLLVLAGGLGGLLLLLFDGGREGLFAW